MMAVVMMVGNRQDNAVGAWKFCHCCGNILNYTVTAVTAQVNAIDPAVPSQPRERRLPDIFPSYTIWTCQPSRRVVSGHFPITHRC